MNNPIQSAVFIALAFLVCCLIAASARRWMKPQGAESLAQDQLFEARRQALTHRAQAELHAAMADMYDAQATRLFIAGTPIGADIKLRTPREKMDALVRDGALPTLDGLCRTEGHSGFGKFWATCKECER